MEPDLLADIAAETGKLIIGCGGESVSGTFYWLMVRGTEVQRHFYTCHSELARPYSFGAPISPSENWDGVENSWGMGFLGALQRLGFNYEQWAAVGTKRRMTWTADCLLQKKPFPCRGPLSAAVNRQRETNPLEPENRPSLKIRVGHAGNVTEIDTGIRLDGSAVRKKPWWRFW
jgi:hypothetical protein